MITRRRFAACAMAASLAALAAQAFAQDEFPNRPVTIVAPFPAGSVTDAVTRTLAQALQPSLGQPIVVETDTPHGLAAQNTIVITGNTEQANVAGIPWGVSVIDATTGEVIRQVPGEDAIRLAEKIEASLSAFIDERA